MIANLNEQMQAVAKYEWCHRVELTESGDFVPAENLRYRFVIMRQLFATLFPGRSVLALNEITGVYPVLIAQAGAASVAANHAGKSNCDVMLQLQEATGVKFEVVPQSLLAFSDGRVYVEVERAARYQFVLVQNQIWPLYNASGRCFADIVEGLAHYASEGIVIDWNDASWANPPPPPEYRRDALHAALRERFEFVMAFSDWLTVAAGKLPTTNEGAAP